MMKMSRHHVVIAASSACAALIIAAELWRRRRARIVVVEDYDPQWPHQFDQIRQHVGTALDAHGIQHDMQHVGSTSVPGLAAKPIIDVDIIVKEDNLATTIAALQTLGYQYRGEMGIEGRHAFSIVGPVDGGGNRNTYVCMAGCDALANHINLRDHLRAHPATMLAYTALKKRLAKEFAHDIDGYCEAKTDFIVGVLAKLGMSGEATKAIELANKS